MSHASYIVAYNSFSIDDCHTDLNHSANISNVWTGFIDSMILLCLSGETTTKVHGP